MVQQECNCKKCDEKIQGNKNLREHMQRHIQDQKKFLPCYYCQFKTNSENNFLNHISSVHGAGHTCLTCNNTFRTQEEMIKHVIDNHPKAKPKVPEKCLTCGQEFVMVEHLTEQILRQHTMLTAGGQANIAGQQLVKIWPLQESLRNQGTIKCYDCECMFVSKDLLMNHKREKHYKQRLCNFYHKHGNRRFGDQCLNIHENNNHISYGHRSTIKCRNVRQCIFKAQNRCSFSHGVESVINVSSAQKTSKKHKCV